MKNQKQDAQLEIYKSKIEEFDIMQEKLRDLEDSKIMLEMDNKNYKMQISELESYKETISYLKEEIKKAKEEKYFTELQFD